MDLLNNSVVKFLNKMTDILVLNLLFIFTSLPVFTIGASLSAMYAVSLRSVRYGDGYVVKTYFKAFKQSFKQSTAAFLVTAAAGALLFLDYRFWKAMDAGLFGRIQQVIIIVIAFIIGITAMWLFPLIAKMNDTLITQIKNAVKIAFGYFLPYTVSAAGIAVFAAWLATLNPGLTIIMIIFGFASVSNLQSLFFYKVFSKYLKENPAGPDDPLYGRDYTE